MNYPFEFHVTPFSPMRFPSPAPLKLPLSPQAGAQKRNFNKRERRANVNRALIADYKLHPLRYSVRINGSASEQFVAFSAGPSQSSFLPARIATLPSRMNSVNIPA
jgi:hypothetical protein